MTRLSAICKPALLSALLASAGLALPAAAEIDAQERCARDGFIDFLLDFSRDVTVQKANTLDPLYIDTLDTEAEPEPKMVSRTVALADVEWPVIPNVGGWLNAGREVTITPEGKSGMFVQVRTPDTGNQQQYTFTNQHGCWQLSSTRDDAM